MQNFARQYWSCLKMLPKNIFFFVMIAMIIVGGHTPLGKVIAIAVLIAIVPIFMILHRHRNGLEDSGTKK